MKKKSKKKSKSLNLAAVFSIFFVLLVLVSVFLKIVNVFREARFDGKNHFALNAASNKESNLLISFSPQDNTIYILKIIDTKGKNMSRILNIPINNYMHLNSEIHRDNIKTELFKYLMSFNLKNTSLNRVDMFRLWLYSNSVPVNSIYQQEMSAKDSVSQIKDYGVYSYFIDQKIAEEKIPIEIINGTNISGLGNRLANALSNIGANIIMVSTSEQEEQDSRIEYVDKESYTVKKISQVLSFKQVLSSKKKLGEITIIIGKDSLDKLKF